MKTYSLFKYHVMKPFENAKVGDLVYLPNDPKGYPITNVGNLPLFDTIEVFGLNFMLDGTIRGYGNLGQIIYHHPVKIVDGREPSNCGNHECSMAKYCFGGNPLDYCECPDYWKPKEESCK